MDSGTLSAITGAIPVVGGAISTLINNHSVDAANAASRKFAVEQQDKQNAYNLQMWNMQNDYNSPAKMMERYKAAGLNPNLIYGTSTGNVAGDQPNAAKAEYVAAPHPSVDGARLAGSAVSAYNDMRLGNAQVNNLQAQTTNLAAQTAAATAAALLHSMQANRINAELPFVGDAMKANIYAKNTHANVESILSGYQADLYAANTRRADAETGYTVDKNVREAAMQSVNIREALSRISLNAMNAAKSDAERQEIFQRTREIMTSREFKQMELDMLKHGVSVHDSAPMRVLGSWYDQLTGATKGFIDRIKSNISTGLFGY